MMNITPGPWRIEGIPKHYGGHRIVGPFGSLGITFFTVATDIGVDAALRNMADAKAIAALPDLIELCLEVHRDDLVELSVGRRIEAALKKAGVL